MYALFISMLDISKRGAWLKSIKQRYKNKRVFAGRSTNSVIKSNATTKWVEVICSAVIEKKMLPMRTVEFARDNYLSGVGPYILAMYRETVKART